MPVFAVLGGIGTGMAFVVVTLLHVDVAAAGFGWLGRSAVVFYACYRHRHGLDLTDDDDASPCPSRSSTRRPSTTPCSSRSIRAATRRARSRPRCRLAKRRRRGIHVLVPITVPSSSPLDAEMPEQERAAQTIVEQARLQGGRRVTGHYEKVRAGQAGRLIVEEARELRATAIVMPLPPRQSRIGLRQDARDRAPRPALPRDHPHRRGRAALAASGGGPRKQPADLR